MSAAHGQSFSLNIESYTIEGPNPLSERKTRRILKPYLGKFDSIEPVQEAAAALESAIRGEGFAFYVVSVPPQPVKATDIKLLITDYPIKSIQVIGNKHFSEKNILRGIPALEIGKSPKSNEISKSLRVVNAHPSKRARIRFPTPDDKGVPAQITVRDSKPSSLFLWGNNTGSEDTGENRVGMGFQYTNLFYRDHSLIGTWTTSPNQDADVSQFGFSYRIPMYRAGGVLSILAAKSDIDTGIVAEVFDVAGKGDAYSIQFTRYFPKLGEYNHQMAVGLDDKLYDNDIDFEGSPIGIDVRSRPAFLKYAGSRIGERIEMEFDAGYFHNISGGGFNTPESYAASRAGASEDWSLTTLSTTVRAKFGNWALELKGKVQDADQELIPGEQISLTGSNNVRGFEEGELSTDRGYYGTIQLKSPTWKNFQFVVFYDAAKGRLVNPLPGQVAEETISSAGVGLSWTWKNDLALSLQWARVIDGSDPDGPGVTRDDDSKVHFNFLIRR